MQFGVRPVGRCYLRRGLEDQSIHRSLPDWAFFAPPSYCDSTRIPIVRLGPSPSQATRDDVDMDRLAYHGRSAGGECSRLYMALDDRVRAAVVIAAGFHDSHMLDEPGEIDP